MKVAQMLTTIPDALPADFAAELTNLQSQAPPMGAAFVRRRMQAELGPDWRERFAEFDSSPPPPPRSARCIARSAWRRAARLQTAIPGHGLGGGSRPGAARFDLFHSSAHGAGDRHPRDRARIGARIREELDYQREAKVARLYKLMLADRPLVRVPEVYGELSTRRLLTLEWLDGAPLMKFERASQEARNRIALALFNAWWRPLSRYGIIHGDPHLGNYSVVATGEGEAMTIEAVNLYDYGCVRIFPATFVGGVVELYEALKTNDEARVVHAFEIWGFRDLSRGTIAALTIWARFIYGPLIEDRVRTIADGVKPGEYGRRELFQVMQALKAQGGGLRCRVNSSSWTARRSASAGRSCASARR